MQHSKKVLLKYDENYSSDDGNTDAAKSTMRPFLGLGPCRTSASPINQTKKPIVTRTDSKPKTTPVTKIKPLKNMHIASVKNRRSRVSEKTKAV